MMFNRASYIEPQFEGIRILEIYDVEQLEHLVGTPHFEALLPASFKVWFIIKNKTILLLLSFFENNEHPTHRNAVCTKHKQIEKNTNVIDKRSYSSIYKDVKAYH